MNISDIAAVIGAKCVQSDYTDKEIAAVYTGDLLSDILGNADDNCIIITIQAHRNTVAVATTKDCRAIIVCNDRPVPDDMLSAAKDEKIAVFLTSENQFMVSGKLYTALGCGASC